MEIKLKDKLSSFEAQKIIDALRAGTVPMQYLDLLTAGREFWLDSIKEDLAFITQGASKVRFIAAYYGGGKTHFLNLVKREALLRNFAVAYVELNSRESPMDKFEIIFPKIMRGVVISNSENGLEAIFDHWISNFKIYSRREIETKLREIAPSMDFRAALRAYLEFAGLDSPEAKDYLSTILGWLCGNKLTPSFVIKTGIRNSISVANVSEILGSFLRFVRNCGFSGLLLLLDEAEAVTSLAQSKRRTEANQNIKKLLDNADNHMGFFILFATTPKFLDDPEVGAKSYPALWDRIKDVLDISMRYPNKRGLIIPLQPLKKNDLLRLGNIIVPIHELAYGWNGKNRLRTNAINQYADQFQKKSKERLVRTYIRGLVSLLDLVEQNEDFNVEKEIENIQFPET
jgi:hypothetical protein